MSLITKNNQYYFLFYSKSGILLFWGLWFFIAFLRNMFDFLNVIHITNTLRFHSGNYDALAKVLSVYKTPQYFLNILFLLDIFIQMISAISFLIAAFCFWRNNNYLWQTINIAFSVSMALWIIFLIMEEIFIAYSYEAVQIRLLMLEMISLLFLHLLPHKHET